MPYKVFLVDDVVYSVEVLLLSICPFLQRYHMHSKKCFNGINLMSYKVFLVDDAVYSIEVPLLSTLSSKICI